MKPVQAAITSTCAVDSIHGGPLRILVSRGATVMYRRSGMQWSDPDSVCVSGGPEPRSKAPNTEQGYVSPQRGGHLEVSLQANMQWVGCFHIGDKMRREPCEPVESTTTQRKLRVESWCSLLNAKLVLLPFKR